MRGLFVTGTDTGAGKSIVAAALIAALAARGLRVAAFKPAITGLDDPPPDGWPHDDELLAAVASAGQSPREVAPLRFGPPVSPHHAAERAGVAIDPAEVAALAERAAAGADAVVCEGVGGLLVPLTSGYTVRDLVADCGLPVVIAARPGLGTINHTLMTLEAARGAALEVRAVVLTPWPESPAAIELSNRATIEALGDVAVACLPHTTPADLAAAGAQLPIDEWL